ncbi:DNA polymerase III subunit gamma/tau, partial [Candidatus Collierbacteria bacterium]|nr:DNA polymerase III subunit gamma/tau [Candidatus Collierbacteria bacterium]
MSYYQKYRPEKIEELDLGQAREAFKKMMAAGEMAHAYLLVGPRGSGKTSSARILARLVNCEKNIKPLSGSPLRKGRERQSLVEPCGKCGACVSIKNGSAVDVMEIDAASHRGIDDIRDLREKVRLAPAILSKKVYIIDEVHMLTTEAFNALLKTLEEPPAHAMFILCTTEAHKIPGTIASRCVRINFTKAGRDELITSLERAVEGEGLSVDKEALELLADSVDGSFREGHKLLEQLAVSGKKITVETVRAGLKLSGADQVSAILAAVTGGNTKEVIKIIKTLENEGAEVTDFVTRLLLALREKIAQAVGSNESVDKAKVRLVNSLIKV